MRSKFTIYLLIALVLVSLIGCAGQPSSTEDDGRIKVVTTIGQLTDTVSIVGGDLVNVTGLMGPGIDPHLYVATESNVGLLQEAEIIFYNGLFLEAQMNDILEQLAKNKHVVPVGENIPTDKLLDSPIYQDEHDPHIWFDVSIWMQVVEVVRDTLTEYDPENSTTYQENAAAYLLELENLHAYVLDQASKIPEEKRVLITAHDAFNYFGQAYGFEVLGLQGISTAAEAGTGDVQTLAEFIVEHQIPAIFIESSVPVRNIEALQAAVASRGFQVEIGGELFSDAMGNVGTFEGTYIGMVSHNIDTIASALIGQ
ncbi:MAG TPA: manganese transporter [Chloroflexi bacterium]|nr:manganese transporter [Chloroflexota bacterium]